MRSQPGSLGQGKGWERSMQGQGHAWAQPASRASHVGESVALAQRLVLLGVERLPFQVGLADLGRRAQAVSRVPGVPSHAQPQLPSHSALASCRRQGAAGSEAPAQSEVGNNSWTRGPRAVGRPPHVQHNRRELRPRPASSQHPGRGGRGRRVAHRTDEASVVPAEPQRLQEPVPSIDLEVAAAALGAKHLLVVCEQRQSPGQRSPRLRPLRSPCRRAQPGDISLPGQDRDKA